MKKDTRDIQTELIHGGEMRPGVRGAVCMPIFQTAMYEYTGESDDRDLKYIRLNNTPNHQVLHSKLARIEAGEAALVASSGMAAISTSLLAVLSSGDHLLVQDCLYGGTHDLLTKDFPGFGLDFDFIDADRPETWKTKLKPKTKAILVETISNPLIQVCDLEAVVDFAREHGLVSLIDNTFASPVNFRPLEHGFDLSLHSCTKYLNGHSDLVAGAVIGSSAWIRKITHKLNHLGGALDPHACFLLHRGMKTLAVRVGQQNRSALELAEMLSQHPAVRQVNYPGLETHTRHQRARKLFDGFGGMLSMELEGGREAAMSFMEKVRLPVLAPSLGGVESLLTLPATTSHLGLSPEDRERMGVTDGLVRISVGIESTSALVDDFKQAL
ncbi:MAG: trans-sulfuration enzyme family protein [Acidobacteriota bacterium]